MPDPIRVLIADDHLIVREGLRLILETAEGMELVGEAADGAEAVRLASQLQPDVVLMDLRMPGMDGLTAIERLRADATAHRCGDPDHLQRRRSDGARFTGRCARLSAQGYRSRDAVQRDPCRGARRDAAQAGDRGASADAYGSRLASSGGLELTDREHEVLEGVAQGERSKEIAARLGITERTVKAHLTSIYNKLGVDSRAAAVAEAAQRGWLS